MQREAQDRSNETTKYEIPRPNRFFFIYSKIDYEDNFFKKKSRTKKILKKLKTRIIIFQGHNLKIQKTAEEDLRQSEKKLYNSVNLYSEKYFVLSEKQRQKLKINEGTWMRRYHIIKESGLDSCYTSL